MKKKLSKIFGISLAVVLLASLTLVSVPVGALSTPMVSLSNYEISKTGVTYTVTLTLAKDVAEGADIKVVFPTGTDLTTTEGALANVKMSGTSGLGSAAFSSKDSGALDGTTTAGTLLITVGDVNAENKIGAGALIQLSITQVVNAPALGAANLSVGTQTAAVPPVVIEAAVVSDSFTLIEPQLTPLPGVVMYKNTTGVTMGQTNSIITAIANSQAGWTIEVGPGTYDEDINVSKALTITSTDGAATTVIKDADANTNGGTLQVTAKATVSGLTISGNTNAGTAYTVEVSVDGAVVEDCVLSAPSAAAYVPVLNITAGVTATPVLATSNTISAGAGQAGVQLANGKYATVSGGTITASVTGEGVINDGFLTLTGVALNGGSGVGLRNTANGNAKVTGSTTFTGLDTAIDVDAGTVDVSTSIITGCGSATTGALKPAINVDNATLVTIGNNTIADCADEILQVANVAGLGGKVFMNFNAINSPAKGIDNGDATVKVDATNNLWDGGTAPPVTSTNATTTPYLVAATEANAKISVGAATLIAKTTVGVDVTGTKAGGALGANPACIAAANYASNPGTAAVPGVASAYYDVYVNDTGSDADTYTISLYGTVDANTKAYVWGAGLGEWVLCSNQSVNIFAGSVTVTVTATTIPTITDLVGLPLALAQPSTTPPTVGITGMVPAMGADDVSVDPTFAWGAVAGATYEFALAEDLALADAFSVIDYSATADVNAHPCRQTLKYSTTYYWRVRAVVGAVKGPWTTGLFTTEAEPEEDGGDIVVDVPDITVESPDITVQPAEVDITVEPASPVIPDYLLWVIIAVGAVLVIALIVLIVRTRRTA